jgi:hypothetical protein
VPLGRELELVDLPHWLVTASLRCQSCALCSPMSENNTYFVSFLVVYCRRVSLVLFTPSLDISFKDVLYLEIFFFLFPDNFSVEEIMLFV